MNRGTVVLIVKGRLPEKGAANANVLRQECIWCNRGMPENQCLEHNEYNGEKWIKSEGNRDIAWPQEAAETSIIVFLYRRLICLLYVLSFSLSLVLLSRHFPLSFSRTFDLLF